MDKSLPQELFIKIDGDEDCPYFTSSRNIEELAETGEKIRVGRYRLVEESEIELVAQIKRIK